MFCTTLHWSDLVLDSHPPKLTGTHMRLLGFSGRWRCCLGCAQAQDTVTVDDIQLFFRLQSVRRMPAHNFSFLMWKGHEQGLVKNVRWMHLIWMRLCSLRFRVSTDQRLMCCGRGLKSRLHAAMKRWPGMQLRRLPMRRVLNLIYPCKTKWYRDAAHETDTICNNYPPVRFHDIWAW